MGGLERNCPELKAEARGLEIWEGILQKWYNMSKTDHRTKANWDTPISSFKSRSNDDGLLHTTSTHPQSCPKNFLHLRSVAIDLDRKRQVISMKAPDILPSPPPSRSCSSCSKRPSIHIEDVVYMAYKIRDDPRLGSALLRLYWSTGVTLLANNFRI